MTEMQFEGLFDLKDKVAVITGGEYRYNNCNYGESIAQSKQDREESASTLQRPSCTPAAAK